MAAPRKYPDELRERATRMVLDLLEEDPAPSEECSGGSGTSSA